MKARLLSAAVVACAAGAASAGTQSFSTPFQFSVLQGSQVIALPQFNLPGMTLQSISFTMNATLRAKVIGENIGTSPATLTASLTGSIGALGPGVVALADSLNFSSGAIPVTGTDGIFGSGTDSYNFGTIGVTQVVDSSPSVGLEVYSGSGGLPITINATGRYTLSSSNGNAYFAVQDFQALGSASITYTYAVIPTPGAAALCVAAGAASCVRRRRRAV